MNQDNYSAGRIRTFLLLLTLVLMGSQLLIFALHYQVSSLVDSLVNSSLPHQFLYPAILFPLLAFLLIQIIAYMIGFNWLCQINQACRDFFNLSGRTSYYLGILLWVLTVMTVFSLNRYYFSHSFFAYLYDQIPYFSFFNKWLMLITATPLLFATGIFYYQMLITGTGKWLGLFLLTFVAINMAIAFAPFPRFTQANYSSPNIIIIGFDSLRPDFVGYFNETPSGITER